MTDTAELLARVGLLSDTKRELLLRLLTSGRREPVRPAAEPIAIVGLGCRFPGEAHSLAAFWRLLESGTCGVREVPPDRWDIDAYYDPDPDAVGKMSTRWGGFLDDVAGFDARFFGIAPREAAHVDPQQRLLLEVAWEALEDAGIAPDRLRTLPVGIFVGISTNDYSQIQIKRGDPAAIDAYFGTGNALSMAAGRVSYVLGLQGPSISVDTACSSSLVAVHLACQSLRAGEATVALAGGVNVMLLPEITVNFSKARMMASDGRCKTFDARADGYVRGEGCGIIVLKRLADALAAGDDVRAVIRGSAVNHDGRSAGLTVPNGAAQAALIRRALEEAGVLPSEVQYVEAHGSGTSLGDPIELRVLAEIFQAGRTGTPLAVGSVKTNIGHLEAAAGIAGLIKVVLAFRHGSIPRHLHLRELTPHVADTARELSIPVETVPWPAVARRLAGVSSFGFAGTNAHVVLEAASAPTTSTGASRSFEVLVLSAPTESALRSLTNAWARELRAMPAGEWANACHTSTAGRAHFAHRLALVAPAARDAAALLEDPTPGSALARGTRGAAAPPICFLFTGQGAVFPHMARTLYETQPVFRRALDRCDEWLRTHAALPLLERVYGPSATQDALTATACAQPAIFSLQYAMVEMWHSWGVTPAAVIGHSVGEFAAAWAAGVLELEEALSLVAERGRLLQELPPGGAMATVQASEADLAPLLESMGGAAVVAATNAPHVTTISGPADAIERALETLRARRVPARRLDVSHAFHSPLLEPALDAVEASAGRFPSRPPRLLWISTLTGHAFDASRGPDALYWRRQLREPVRFDRAVGTLAAARRSLLLEIGPAAVLATLARRAWPGEDGVFLTSLSRGQDDWKCVLKATAELYVHGVDIEWPEIGRGFARRSRPMPTYPFERQRYWINSAAPVPQRSLSHASPTRAHPLLGSVVDEPSTTTPTTVRFEPNVGVESVPILAGHRVNGSIVLPAAALVEMAFASARALLGSGPKRLRNLAIRRVLVLPARESLRLEVRLDRTSARDAQIEIRRSGVAAAVREMPDATAQVERLDAEPRRALVALDAVRARCATRLTGREFYAQLRPRGFEYGTPFDAVTDVAIGNGEAVGRVEIPADSHGAYVVHPALLDGCIHVAAAALPLEWRESNEGGIALPVRIESAWLSARVPTPVWSRACLRSGATTEQAVVDITIIDAEGVVAGELAGVELMRRDSGDRDVPRVATYQIQWQSCAVQSAAARQAHGAILVLAANGARGAALAAGLTAGDRRAVVVPFDVTTADAAWRRLLPDRWSDVVYVAGDGDPVEECDGLRQVAAGLAGHAAMPRLVVMTHRGQVVNPSDTAVAPAQAALWGFTRALTLERPELRTLLIEVADDGRDARGVAQLLSADVQEDEIAVRDGRFLAPRLTPFNASSAAARVRSDRTHIVTGGFGALGSRVAARLIAMGARHIVLTGRSIRPEVAEHIAAAGARVMTAAADVTHAADLERLRDLLRQEDWPEVGGIVHAAGVLEDRTVDELDADVLRRVMGPKIDGVRHLEATFGDGPLDYFMVFSSAAAALGSPGQAAYAGANAALDTWACARRRRARPALSIGWGGWRGLGMAARASASIPTLDPSEALDAFEALAACDGDHVIVLPAAARAGAVAGRRSLLAELRAAERAEPSAAGPPSASPLRTTVASASPAHRDALVLDYVRKQAAAALGLLPDALDVAQPLTDLGLDSLMAMDIRAHLINDLDVPLPVARLLEEPTVERIAAELIVRLGSGSSTPVQAAAPETGEGEFPLSRGQMAMWFLHQLAPETTAYHLGDAVRIDGTLDVAALGRGFDALMLRHPALRTTVVCEGRHVRQRVHPQVPVGGFELRDRSECDSVRLVEELRAEMERPFDLEHGPLTRLLVLRRRHDEHYILLCMHHIVGELWALILIVEELSRLYRADVRGTTAALPPLAASYAGFVAHEQRLLASADGERLAAYWTRKLTPLAPPLTLATARTRPAVQTYRGALEAFGIAAEAATALKQLAREEQTTLFAALLAAFLVLLRRESGQTDLVIGSPMTGRTRPEWSGVIGYFDNPIPLRVDLSGEPTFREVIRRARTTVLEAFEHQAFPFPLIVERAQPPRDPSRSPLFDVMFVLRKSPVADLQRLTQLAMGRAGALLDLGEGLRAESIDLDRRVSQLDLTLAVTEEESGLIASWEYNADLFDRSAIASLTGHFLTLLTAATARPDDPIDRLQMITAAERRMALEDWNATSAFFPADRLLHHGFDEQAACNPAALAIIAEGREITYGELDRASCRVALWLRSRGVTPNHLVAVVMHKGWEQVVAVLGVLKGGGAYVPIDARLPHERIRHLLERCAVRCALTQPAALDRFAWPEGIEVREIIPDAAAEEAEPLPAPATRPEDVAYVIFTSGSTGVPKGVVIDHRGAWNTVYDVNTRFDVGSRDRVLALSSLSFDLSVYDIFGTLAAGGAIVIPRAADSQDPAHWADLARRHAVTVWNSVPSLLDLLVQYLDAKPHETPASLRLALLSGDWIPVSLPDRARRRFPGLQAIGMGGATEASIWSILCPIDRVDPAWTSIPYGRPMANQTFYVLDTTLEPCPVGLTGDLYIGGIGLALGYWRDQERTRAAFLTHPRTGERLHRTGDLGRYHADGTIEFLGRADGQVKVRGFRVEPGEIEAVLSRAPGVHRVVVAARDEEAGAGKRLVAYIVCDSSEPPQVATLRLIAAERLPDYMVPSAFVLMDSLPLSPNGKVNLRALPPPGTERDGLDTPYEAPRDALEARLAALWTEVLRVPRVGVHDDFFALGGDSIHSIQISVRAGREGLRINPRHVFEDATVAALAARLRAASVEASPSAETVAAAAAPRDSGTYVAADFPLARLSEQQLQGIVARFQSHDG